MLSKKSLLLALVAGACCSASALAQPAATDLGTLTPSATPIVVTATYAAASVTWYRFQLTSPVVGPLYLDIDTRLPSAASDTELGLYRANDVDPTQSVFIATDDDDGNANLSALSFGACTPTRPADGTGAVPNGRDGGLRPGVYYLAVGSFNVDFGATNYAATVTSGGAGTTTLTLTLNTTGVPAAPTFSAASGASGAPGASSLLTATISACAGADSVAVNLSSIGGSATTAMVDDGTNGDLVAGDNIYSTTITLPSGAGQLNFLATATNSVGSTTRNIPVVVNGEGVVKAIRISQATGAGGLSASDAAYDYVELYNADITSADLSGYSLQIAAATGTAWTSVVMPVGFTMQPGRYALIRLEAQSATGIVPALTPDVVGTTSTLGSTGGKIALVNTTATLTGAVPVVPGTAVYIDRLGYGAPSAGFAEGTARPAPSSPNRILVRGCNGALDANNNNTDFAPTGMTATLPRNSTSAASNSGPGLNNVTVTPASGLSPFSATVTAAAAPCGAGVTISSMKINLSAVGGPANAVMLDNGANGDGGVGDGVYGITGVTVTGVPGTYTLPIRLVDSSGNITNGSASVTINVPPPANDECANATALSGVGQFAFNNFNATTSTPAFSCGLGGTDIWYRWTPSAPGAYSIRTCDTAVSFDTVLQVYNGANGCPIDSTTSLGCNDDGTTPCGGAATIRLSKLELTGIIANNPYYIRVGTFNAAAGAPGTLTIEALGTRATGVATPATIAELGTASFFVTASPAAGTTISSVTVDATSIGGGASVALLDNGVAPDVTAGDSIFSGSVVSNVAAGAYTVPFTATDSGGGTAAGTMNLTITVQAGSCCVGPSCSTMGAFACQAAGGTYGGPGTTCGGPSSYEIVVGGNSFEDISATGVRLATVSDCDDCGQVAPIGFDFNFFGTIQSSVWVCSNGFAQFGTSNSTSFTNAPIPTAGTPDNIIAPLWDDYDLDELSGGAGDIYVLTDGAIGSRRCVISWQNVQQFNTTPPAISSFQIVLREGTNAIEFRYGALSDPTVNSDTTSASIGVENSNGSVGTSYDVTLVVPGNNALNVNVATSVPNPCSCSTDVNGDGVTDPDDLADAISCFFDPGCNFDYDRSGFEDPDDLSTYISDFFTPNFCG